MLKNNLKLVFRRLRKERLFTFVNIFGLTIGLTAFLLISLYVKDELSYDQFHSNKDQLYRLIQVDDVSGERNGFLPADFVEFIVNDIPSVSSFTRITQDGRQDLLQTGTRSLYSDKVLFTDANFFETFSFKLIDGNAENVLSASNQVVLTEDFALKLFGKENPIGKEIKVNKTKTLIVTGISENLPKNSVIQFELMARMSKEQTANTFDMGYMKSQVSYLYIPYNTDKELLTNQINELKSKPNYGEAILGKSTLELLPLVDQRLKSGFSGDIFEINDVMYIYLFSGIGLVILLLAIINYINMVIAQSLGRSKEIGIRKIIGANKAQLVANQLVVSIVVTIIALILAFAITERLVPKFNDYFQKSVELNYLSFEFIVMVPLFGLILGVIAGLYPAFYISKYKAMALVQKAISRTKSPIRRVLITCQFAIAGIMILVTVMMNSQMQFIQNQKMGFNKEFLVYIPLFTDLKGESQIFKNEVLGISGVSSATITNWMMGDYTSSAKYSKKVDIDSKERPLYVQVTLVNGDKDLVQTLELETLQKIVDFEFNQLDSTQLIITKSVAEGLDWGNDALGKYLYSYGGERKKIVAVVADFHSASLKRKIEPTTIEIGKIWSNEKLLIRLEAKEYKQALETIGKQYEVLLNRPFEYKFVDQEIERFYEKEAGQINLFNLLSSLAIFISLLGLTALTVFMLEQRRKEVSIRKVLGASVQKIILMLNKEYTLLVILAFIIASPVAYYTMQDWLAEFKYRIEISPMLFIGGFLGFLALCWMVSIFQSLKVSGENPADVLRED
jgi:putative ABC transport system permease protein